MIEFKEVSTGEAVGNVDLLDGKLKADPALQSIVDAWERQDKTPEEFMQFYGSWSNGYLESAETADDAPAETEQAKAMRLANKFLGRG